MSKYKCLVISGILDSGKTTLIKNLINNFKQDSSNKLIREGSFSDHNRKTNDCWAIIEINDNKIGFFSQGDCRSGIEHGLRETKDCEFVVGASHLYGDTVDTYFDYEVRHFDKGEVLFINKIHFDEDSYLSASEKFVDNIKELIKLYL